MPSFDDKCSTILDYFEKRTIDYPNENFLGTRTKLSNDSLGMPIFGEYTWKTNKEVETTVKCLTLAIEHRKLANQTEGDDKSWSFIGIWSKNRREWLETYIANMYFNRTTIGFFDSMGVSAVDFILEQTELSCIFCTPEYISKIVGMKKEGLAKNVTSLVSFESVTPEQVSDCESSGVLLIEYQALIEEGKNLEKIDFRKCTADDCPIFSYTSGTTGDSKGVKLTHANLCASAT